MFEVTREAFEAFVLEGVEAIPEKFRKLLSNVAFLVDDVPTPAQRKENHLHPRETLLGLYEGVPRPARGAEYGGLVLPDRITIFQRPIEEEALLLTKERFSNNKRPLAIAEPEVFRNHVRQLVADTVWHEVAHHFGLDETEVKRREAERGRAILTSS